MVSSNKRRSIAAKDHKMESQSVEVYAGLHRSTGRIAGLLIGLAALAFGRYAHGADVVVDSYQTFQTIVGWGDGGGFYNGITGIAGNMLDPSVVNAINYQYFDYLADDLGLTGRSQRDQLPVL
jgi:hypothetical protein